MKDQLSIESLTDEAKRIMPKGCHVWLYGSRARGTATQKSDWDILVLVDKPSIDDDDFNRFSYPLMEYGWRYGEDLNPQLYTMSEWNQMRITPYYQNVERDKKLIYES